MRFLITGANGFVGANLTRALVEKGADVRCLVRPGGDVRALEGVKARIIEGDVTEEKSLDRAAEGAEVCFHLAGIRRSSRQSEFMRVNADGTRHVADALLRAGGRRLVLCSSLAASGPSGSTRPRVEDDPLCPEEWYGESKAEAERIALSYAGRLEVTVIRPARILGPGDRENLPFFRIARRGLVLKLGGPERLISVVDVDDVVQQLLLQGQKKEAVGQAFFSASDDRITLEDLMRLVADVVHVKPRTLYVPEVALRAVAEAADVVTRTTGRRLPINRKLARQLLAPGWVCSIDKAKRLLGYQPTVAVRESVRRSADAYRADGMI